MILKCFKIRWEWPPPLFKGERVQVQGRSSAFDLVLSLMGFTRKKATQKRGEFDCSMLFTWIFLCVWLIFCLKNGRPMVSMSMILTYVWFEATYFSSCSSKSSSSSSFFLISIQNAWLPSSLGRYGQIELYHCSADIIIIHRRRTNDWPTIVLLWQFNHRWWALFCFACSCSPERDRCECGTKGMEKRNVFSSSFCQQVELFPPLTAIVAIIVIMIVMMIAPLTFDISIFKYWNEVVVEKMEERDERSASYGFAVPENNFQWKTLLRWRDKTKENCSKF